MTVQQAVVALVTSWFGGWLTGECVKFAWRAFTEWGG